MEKDVIIFSEGRTSIERNVLSDIRGLRKVHIPSSVQTIDTSAFSGIKTLEEITVDENNANYVSVDGILYSKDMKKLINVPPAKELVSFVIPESVEEIESYAFEDCVSLEHCIIEHDNAESINNGILDQFTPAQLLEFIDYAAEKGSVNCSSMLQEYKHNKYPEYDAFYEFVID
jgi:hypothetical protein